MNNLESKMQQAQYDRMVGSQMSPYAGNFAQSEMPVQSAPSSPYSLLALLNEAHAAADILQCAVDSLGGQLMPLRSAVPAKEGTGPGSVLGDPEAISCVKNLISRLIIVTETVRNISAEVRL